MTYALNEPESTLEDPHSALAGERARVERLLDDLPVAVLLVADGGLAYANGDAKDLLPALLGDADLDALGGDLAASAPTRMAGAPTPHLPTRPRGLAGTRDRRRGRLRRARRGDGAGGGATLTLDRRAAGTYRALDATFELV